MKALAEQIGDVDGVNIYGRVVGVRGLMVEIAGPIHAMSVGARIVIETGGNRFIPAEVIGFSGNNAVVMPFAGLDGVRARLPRHDRQCRKPGAAISIVARPCHQRDGGADRRQGSAGARPVADGRTGTCRPRRIRASGSAPRSISACAPLNTFLTCCRGQRLGIFAGSGVGKSVLLSMLARNVDADITVIGLIGERGREVQEFCRTTSAMRAWRARWWWWRPPMNPL